MFRARGGTQLRSRRLGHHVNFHQNHLHRDTFFGGAWCRDTPRFVEEPSLRVSEGCELGRGRRTIR